MHKYRRLDGSFIKMLLLLLCFTPLWANSSENDSLQKQEIINVIVAGVQQMNEHQYDNAIKLFEKADSMSVATHNLKFQASCQYNLGVTHYRSGDYIKCGEYFDKALELINLTNDSLVLAQYNLGIGVLYKRKGDFNKASEYVIMAIRVLELTDKTQLVASAYNTMAGIQNKLNNDSLAYKYYQLSLLKYVTIKDSSRIASVYNNIGNYFLEKENLKNAKYYLHKSLDLKKMINKNESIWITANTLGEVYFRQNIIDSASYFFNLAYTNVLNTGVELNQIEVCHSISKLLAHNNEYDSALYYIEIARPIALKNNTQNFLLENYEISSQIYDELGDHRLSLYYLKKYKDLNEKVLNADLAKSINDLQFQYETEKKDLQIANLNKINEIKTQSLILRNWGLIIISILLLLSVLLVIKVYFDFRQKKKAHEQIRFLMHEKQHRTKNNLQLLSSVLSMQSQSSQKELKEASMTGENRVQSIVLLDKLLYEENKEGDEIELSTYINELLSGLIDAYDTNGRIEIRKELLELRIAAEQAKYIGLLVNEIITNSFKYAFPNIEEPQLRISFKKLAENKYELIISDNGPGLPDNFQSKSPDSLGMKLIRTMSRQLKGDYLIENREGFYYQLQFEIKRRG